MGTESELIHENGSPNETLLRQDLTEELARVEALHPGDLLRRGDTSYVFKHEKH